MRQSLLDLLSCPGCGSSLKLKDAENSGDRIRNATLVCTSCKKTYPVTDYIPRFVPETNYADNFGFQWNEFAKTQLDSHSGTTISRDRFFSFSGWNGDELAEKTVLDAGCGAGRFTEIALSCGAKVVALDYSSSVDACYANLGTNENLHVVQADIYHMPFHPATFDYVYCFGVLQHTPDVKKSFMSLVPMPGDEGKLAVDVYPQMFRNVFWSKYWLRPITKRMSKPKLFNFSKRLVKYILPVSRSVSRVPHIGRNLKYLLPVVNYYGVYPLSCEQHKEWSLLDTFDMLGPEYDSPQTIRTIRRWFEEAGFCDVEVFRKGFIVGRGRRC